MDGHPWPLFDLRIRTPRLELRVPTDDDLLALARVGREGIVPEGKTVFMVPWDQLPSPAFERQFLLHWWAARGRWSPANWGIGFAVVADGQPIGMQDLMARDFAIRKTVLTASWLAARYQGHGYGTEMRAAVLALAFDGLGAAVAESGYFQGNRESARVSEKMGYVDNGLDVANVQGQSIVEQRVRVTPETWRRELVEVTIENLAPCLALFGIGNLSPSDWAAF